MGAHIGDTRQLQQPLNGAVLAVLAVEHREYHVDPLAHHAVTFKAQQTLAADGGNGGTPVAGIILPLPGGQQGIILAGIVNPVSVLGDAHGEHIVFAMVNIVQDGLRAAQRNLMLRADASEQNTYTQLFHDPFPLFNP